MTINPEEVDRILHNLQGDTLGGLKEEFELLIHKYHQDKNISEEKYKRIVKDMKHKIEQLQTDMNNAISDCS